MVLSVRFLTLEELLLSLSDGGETLLEGDFEEDDRVEL